MTTTLNTLLRGAIDYAGLFPPAKLPLDEAIHHYARYRQSPDAWMLGRFVCPVARLAELNPYISPLFSPQFPLPLSALGRGGDSPAAFAAGFAADGEAVDPWLAQHGDSVSIDVLETRLPPGASVPERAGQRSLFFEVPLGPDYRCDIPVACRVLADAGAGFKLRCGGLDAQAFPSVEQVAFVLHACQTAGVPIKFTAGLHHPLRRFDAGVQTHMHGFVNVLVAGLLAARGADEDVLRTVLADENPAAFSFGDGAITWGHHAIPLSQIAPARLRLTSFGSCSFDEPREDLRALGWLAS